MNVDGAFILAETRRKTSVLLFVDNSMQIFLRYISLRFWEDVCHTYHIVTRLKINKKIKQMMSKCLSARISSCFGLWTLAPWVCAALFEYMQFVRVLENITFRSLFTNHLRPFHDFNHHSNQQQPPLPLLIGDMRCSSLSLSVFRACNDVCVFLSLTVLNTSTLQTCLLQTCLLH